MNNLIDLELAEKDVKDAQDRLEGLQAHVYKIHNEIALLLHIEKQLLENISILKSRHIITVAIEYRKAKEDLRKIYSNLTMLKLNKNSLEHSVKQAEKFLSDCREKHSQVVARPASRVIEVDFGRKDDRQSRNPT